MGLVSLSDDNTTPSVQKKNAIVAGVSIRNDIPIIQQTHVYDEPRNFQFFKELPTNTFGRTVAKKRAVIFRITAFITLYKFIG